MLGELAGEETAIRGNTIKTYQIGESSIRWKRRGKQRKRERKREKGRRRKRRKEGRKGRGEEREERKGKKISCLLGKFYFSFLVNYACCCVFC